MFSEKEKRTLSRSTIRRKPRYVRIPLQMDNRVRVLKTDVNSAALSERFARAMSDLATLAALQPIYHLRADFHTVRTWQDRYNRFCDAFRSFNQSRVLRRLHITGFRLCNVQCDLRHYHFLSDTYVLGTDPACILFDAFLRFLLPVDQVKILLHLQGSARELAGFSGHLRSLETWNHHAWRLQEELPPHNHQCTLALVVPTVSAADAINIVLSTSRQITVERIRIPLYGISLDTELHADFKERHDFNDIDVLLSGYRLRKFQRFGQLNHKSLKPLQK